VCGLSFISFSTVASKQHAGAGWKKTKSHIISARCGCLKWNSTPADERIVQKQWRTSMISLCARHTEHTHDRFSPPRDTLVPCESPAVKVEQFGKNSWLTLPIQRTNTNTQRRHGKLLAAERGRKQTKIATAHTYNGARERITHITNTQSVGPRWDAISKSARSQRVNYGKLAADLFVRLLIIV
jgi:hypothetical protein